MPFTNSFTFAHSISFKLMSALEQKDISDTLSIYVSSRS